MKAKSQDLKDDVPQITHQLQITHQNKVALFAINRFVHDLYEFKCFLRLLAKIKVKSHSLQDDCLSLMSPQNTRRKNIDLQCLFCNASA